MIWRAENDSRRNSTKLPSEIDRLFHWSSRLHQEQLKFVSKYPKVMEKYRQALGGTK